ncbi:MAG: acetyl-CoA carboxylase, biotin carboxyl carrier protein [Proteobacteria bacterium]|nr:acetyl-CoA carboxylase, biotin carboxyl carrier protein [Pseudomonadota bacterium]
MPEKFKVDGAAVRGLAELLGETGLTEIEYQVGDQRIRVVRASLPAPVSHYVPPPAPSAPPPPSEPLAPVIALVPSGEAVPSPMVGTVYLSAEPGKAPFVKAGDMVKKGDTLLIIEAMKVMNPIRAPRDGKIVEICVSDTKPVEFGEPLVILE